MSPFQSCNFSAAHRSVWKLTKYCQTSDWSVQQCSNGHKIFIKNNTGEKCCMQFPASTLPVTYWLCMRCTSKMAHCNISAKHYKLEAPGKCIPPPRHVLPVSRYGSGPPTKFINSSIHWLIANLPWKFHANPFWCFCAKLTTDRRTDKQRRLHNLLGGGNKLLQTLVYVLSGC